jgi:hypothetical protein
MQVGVGVFGHVIVEDNVDSLNVHTTTKQIGGNQYSLQLSQSVELSIVNVTNKPSGSP